MPLKKSWFSWLKLGLNLPNPGKYEEFAKEAAEICSQQEYFDGMKFDFARVLSDNFFVQHTLHMGSSEAEGGGTYSFSPSVSSKAKTTSLLGRFDGDGRVMGKLYHQLTPNSLFLAQAQVSAEHSMVTVEGTYHGSDWVGSAKIESPSVVEVTMMQSILPATAVGMQLIHVPHPQGAITGLSAVARIWSDTTFIKPLSQQKVPRWVFAANMGSLTPLHATFTWHTPYKADFATELLVHPRQDGGLASTWCAGAQYEFNTGRIKARFDSNLRIGVFVEEAISPIMRAYLCGDLDHSNNKYKFGVGISIQ
jgi:hypothetical protein